MISTIIRIWKVHYKIIIWKVYNNSNKDDKNIYNYSNLIGYVSYIPSNLENFEDKSSHLELLIGGSFSMVETKPFGWVLVVEMNVEVSPYPYEQSIFLLNGYPMDTLWYGDLYMGFIVMNNGIYHDVMGLY